jgi:hypothetical protein
MTGACLAVLVFACGGDRALSLSEYAAQGGAMTAVMEERIAALDAGLGTQPVSGNVARDYWDARRQSRVELLEELRTLDPPDAITEMHREGLDLFDRLITAEEALAARVAAFAEPSGPEQWWSTEEADAVAAADEEILTLCRAFQARYDATIDRTGLADMPWIPTEMKEIVQIDVGCEPPDM